MKRLLCRAGWLLATAFSSPTIAAPAGSLDFSYGDGFGTQHVGFNAGGSWDDVSEAMIKGPGGTVYLIGHVQLDNNETGFGLARLSHDGKPDESFGPNGKKFYKESTYKRVAVRDAAMQADGRIVVVARRFVEQPLGYQMVACRFEASGIIDASFGNPQTPGCRSIPSPVGVEGDAKSVLIQSDGRIVMVGYALDGDTLNYHAVAVRLLADGAPDVSFGNQGFNAPGFRILFPDLVGDDTSLSDIAEAANGDLVVTGDFDGGADGHDSDVVIARLKASDGSLDDTFDGSGYVYAFIDAGGARNDRGMSIKSLSDGSVLVTGSAQTAMQEYVPFAVKLDSVGSAFPGFGVGGKKLLDTCSAAPCYMEARDLQIADDGKLLLTGLSTADDVTDFFVMRLLPNGERDGDFGPSNGLEDGVARVNFSLADAAYRVLPQGERVLVAGAADHSGDLEFAIARLDHGIEETFTVTLAPGPGGSMFPEAAQEVNHSDQVEFIVTPDPGFSVLNVEGCGVTEFQGVYITAPVTADCTVTAEFTADLVVTYTAGPNGYIEGLSPQTAVYGGNAKAVEAIGNTGYHFVQWDDGMLDNPRQDTNITQNIDVTALFEINLYEVAPNPGPGGTLSPDETVMVPHGGSTQFIVQPEPGFAIGEFSDCPGALKGNIFVTDPILESCKVTVSFVPSNAMYSLTYLTDGNGMIEGVAQQSVLTGANGSTVTAKPNPGYEFVTWSDGMTNPQRTDTHVVTDIEVTAIFATEEEGVFFSVTPSVIGGGSISPNLVQDVASGDNAVFTLTADPGFVIQGVGGTCGGNLVGNTYTTLAVTANCTVIASFATEQEAADAIFSDGFED